MSRLNKKCFIASASVHSLLLVLLLVGPAFVSEQALPDNLQILDFVPLKTVDDLVSGGGNPNAQSASATLTQPIQPQPTTPPPPKQAEPEPKQPEPKQPDPKPEPKEPAPKKQREPAPEPEPAKAPERQKEPDPDSLELNQKAKPKLPKISTELVTRKNEADKKAKEARAAEARRREREAAVARKQIASAIGSLANNLESGLSSSTTIELRGPGGGGIPYANFLQAVKSIYSRAWIVPPEVTDENATAEAAVVIARDGTVLSFRITKSSRNAEVDRSVDALDRISHAVPLPDNAREDERTVTIKFNVRARRSLN